MGLIWSVAVLLFVPAGFVIGDVTWKKVIAAWSKGPRG